VSRSSRKIKLANAINSLYGGGNDAIRSRLHTVPKQLADGSYPTPIYTSEDELTAALEVQDCRCKLCDRVLSLYSCGNHTACADHNRLTGHFRSWLCSACNGAVGYVERLTQEKSYGGVPLQKALQDSVNIYAKVTTPARIRAYLGG
jgi:hypothetical protein